MINRRDFLRNAGVTALGSMVLSKSATAFMRHVAIRPVGLQLFTFFNVIDNDVRGTLEKVAAVGYREIESAFSRRGGFYGLKAIEFSALLKDLGLSWKSHHVLGAPFKMPANMKPPVDADGKPMTIPPMRNLRDNYQELVDEIAAAGVPYLVCASTPVESLEAIKGSIDILNKTAEVCEKTGITLAYHNHDIEFQLVDGITPYDLLLSETNPDLKMELDLAWAKKGGVDPVALIKKHPGRFPLWHVKDIDQDFKNVLPVGNGIMDFKAIFEQAEIAGLKHFFVEHDMPSDPFASITTSFKNMGKIVK